MTPHSWKRGASTVLHRCCIILQPLQAFQFSRRGRYSLLRSSELHTHSWDVSAFTQGNDLPWNHQTLLSCEGAMKRVQVY